MIHGRLYKGCHAHNWSIESVQLPIIKGLQSSLKATTSPGDSANIPSSKGVVVKSPVRIAVGGHQTANCFVWYPAIELSHQW